MQRLPYYDNTSDSLGSNPAPCEVVEVKLFGAEVNLDGQIDDSVIVDVGELLYKA